VIGIGKDLELATQPAVELGSARAGADQLGGRYRHMSAKADRVIADGLDALVRAEHPQDVDDDSGAAGKLVPVA
jgi:hypothetical protein